MRCGITWGMGRWKLAYGIHHGWFQWMPDWAQGVIVGSWNHVACTLVGHDILIQKRRGAMAVCSACCRKVTVSDSDNTVLRTWHE
jgi:hypothetical protein